MTTRLTKVEVNQAQTHLTDVLDSGIQFIECPLTDEEKSVFWHKSFPDDLLTAYMTLHAHGVGVEYAATTRSIGFVIPRNDKHVFAVRLCLNDAQQGFFTVTQKMLEEWDTVKLANDPYTSWPAFDPKLVIKNMGVPTAKRFFDWVMACALMDDEISNAQTVLEDLFGMIKTAGQLHRMAPDLFQYMPKKSQLAFAAQKRSSHAPYGWAEYDRDKVHRMIGTVHKCFLLKGLGKPSMEKATRGTDNFSWCTDRLIADPDEVTEESEEEEAA